MAVQLDCRDAWTRAKDRYLEDLDMRERQLFACTSPELLLYDASAVEKVYRTKNVSR